MAEFHAKKYRFSTRDSAYYNGRTDEVKMLNVLVYLGGKYSNLSPMCIVVVLYKTGI